MFDQAVQLVCPCGVLVYSTCTINPGENEGVVHYALDTYKFLSLAQQHPRIMGPGLVGHDESLHGHFQEWLRPGEEDLVQRNIEVMVDTSVQAEALIPNPIPEEFIETVKYAIAYILSWTSHLVIPCSGLNKIVAKKKEK